MKSNYFRSDHAETKGWHLLRLKIKTQMRKGRSLQGEQANVTLSRGSLRTPWTCLASARRFDGQLELPGEVGRGDVTLGVVGTWVRNSVTVTHVANGGRRGACLAPNHPDSSERLTRQDRTGGSQPTSDNVVIMTHDSSVRLCWGRN